MSVTDPKADPTTPVAGSAPRRISITQNLWGSSPWFQPQMAAREEAEPLLAVQNRWGNSNKRLIFPAVFLIYLLQTLGGIGKHSKGGWALLGIVMLVVFGVCYVASIPARWSGRDRRFWALYAAMVVLMVAELPLAHEDAFVMCVYLSIIGIASMQWWALPASAVYVVAAVLLPPAIDSWHADLGWINGASIALVSLAMWAFFGIIGTNHALEEARAEVATLAAEGERNRIARDLHDLLGHSLTTITVKAGLAKRLADRDPAQAAIEIGEVEELARQALSDVRAAVSNYRIVTLTTELATAQEVLRATGIDAQVLSPTDVVDADLHELFGWVVREGTTNVVRHARATHCTIDLGPRSIEIVNDGMAVLSGVEGNGLSGLRERVDAVGGTVEAGAATGGGWRVAVSVP